MPKSVDKEEYMSILKMRCSGKSYAEIGRKTGRTRQAVYDLLKKHKEKEIKKLRKHILNL